MPELTLESLAARLAEVEKELAELKAKDNPKPGNWRRTVGMFDDDPEFMQRVIAEGKAIREADRLAGHEGRSE